MIEKPSLINKFEQQDISVNEALNLLCYIQFSKIFSSSNKEPSAGELILNLISKAEALKTHDIMDLIII